MLRLVVDSRHYRRDVETDHQGAKRIGYNSQEGVPRRRRAQDRRYGKNSKRVGDGASSMTCIDVPAENQARDGADQCGKGERAAKGDKTFVKRKKERDLPDEMIAGGDPAIREKEPHAGNGRPVGIGNLTPDQDIRRPQERHRSQKQNQAVHAERNAWSEGDEYPP